jgi:hypothetical protein
MNPEWKGDSQIFQHTPALLTANHASTTNTRSDQHSLEGNNKHDNLTGNSPSMENFMTKPHG